MGKVLTTVRTLIVPNQAIATYVMQWKYDSHNRVRTITYPDGEVVTYGYDAAGQGTSIRSTKQGKEETIVAQVGYDKDGHTIYTRMGNGTESTYAYDRQRERLQGMLLTANGDSIMQTQYKYDPVDNILELTNVITPKAPKKPKGFGVPGRTDGMGGSDAGREKKEKPLGGAFSHTYAYDELNRLTRAEGKAEGPDDVQPGYGYVPADTAHHEDIFYYHTDHLGSTSYITDAKANVAQFDAYLPYGELLVDEHSSTEEMPYKFNGKELDEETGLYYYGARYMNPKTSLWYGVDPLAEKYPSVDGYEYCVGNPVKLIYRDGKKIDLSNMSKQEKIISCISA